MGNVNKINLRKFLAEYLRRGFGMMPKREVDIQIFGELYKQGFFGDDPSTHSISMALQISDTKVKSLIYEMELRDIHKNKEGWLKNRLRKASINYDPTKGIRIAFMKRFICNLVGYLLRGPIDTSAGTHSAAYPWPTTPLGGQSR